MFNNRLLRSRTFFTILVLGGLGFLAVSSAQAQADLPSDQEVVDQAPSYSLDKLVDLLGVYDRLGKRQVTQALADEILKRDPQNASARAVKAGKPVAGPIEPGGVETPEDRLSNQIDALIRRRQFSQLVSLLNKSKKDYRGKAFPFQDDLAYAYYESGNISAAKAAYREIANSSLYPNSKRSMARKSVKDIEDSQRIAKAHELSIAGNHGDALAIIEDLKSSHKGGNFPYENDLGDIMFASGDLDAAEASYKKVANSPGYDSKKRSVARAGLRDVAKGRKLREAHVALREKRPDEAMAIAEELEGGGWNDDADVKLLRAEVMVAQGRYMEAIDGLSTLKAKSYQGKPFPGQSGLASAYHQSNQLHMAAGAYAEILKGKYLPLEQEEAAIELRDINREIYGSIAFDVGYITEEEGDTLHSSVVLKSPIYKNGLRYWAFARHDHLELSGDTSLKDESGERFEGGFAIEKFINEHLSVGAYIGGSESDNGDSDQILFGGSVSKRVGKAKVGAEFAYNERTFDSVALQVLDGRQHRAQLNFETPIGDRLYADGFVYYRQVDALGDEIGDGWGGQLDLLYTIREAHKNRPALRVGYAGEYHKFNSNPLDAGRVGPFLKSGISAGEARGLGNDLVEEEINLHGLKVVVEGRMNDKLSYYVSGALQYDFFDDEIQYSAGTGVEYYINDRVRLTSGLEYYSAGQTSSSDAGVVVGTIGLSITF